MNSKKVASDGSVRSSKSKKSVKNTAKKSSEKEKTWSVIDDLSLDYSCAETNHDLDAPTFVISLAAQMAGMHPQTLRQYDRLGLVKPQRARGGGRRYSPRDLAKLRYVQKLSQELGVNLTGIQLVLELNDKVSALEAEVQELRREIRSQSPVKNRVFMADGSGKVLQRARNLRASETSTTEVALENAQTEDNPDTAGSNLDSSEVARKELPGRSSNMSRSEMVVWGETPRTYNRLVALMKTILRLNNSR